MSCGSVEHWYSWFTQTIGGMIGTGCSGSKLPRCMKSRYEAEHALANAVRYGTAKAEWFLNVVRVGVSSVYN